MRCLVHFAVMRLLGWLVHCMHAMGRHIAGSNEDLRSWIMPFAGRHGHACNTLQRQAKYQYDGNHELDKLTHFFSMG